jgi:hypothetical protein
MVMAIPLCAEMAGCSERLAADGTSAPDGLHRGLAGTPPAAERPNRMDPK